ncbi:MFS transporter [candidate division KSB1 bacterium]|nr:MFS transporter [candidate division KSB1 bacterium]MBL7094930.1 MFS transporter [candidate division KSB1 bacterium]
MIKNLFSFWKTGSNKPLIQDANKIDKLYKRKRQSVIWSVVLGYGFFYIVRLTLSVAKKPMVDAGILDVTQLGIMGSVMFYVYAVGKFTNGFLSDRANIKRFMSTGLLVSAIVNLILGLNSYFFFFVLLWGINGWFQSMGSPPSVVSITQWFSKKEYGTYYGVWAASHNIGEGLTFIGTSTIVSILGWRMGFIGPGLLCLAIAIILFITLQDRPQTYGLPHITDYKKDYSLGKSKKSVGKLQLEVLKSRIVWQIGLAAALLYTARYAIHSWGPFYFQEAKGFSIEEAGWLMGLNTMMGLAGAMSSGFVSDRLFASRRNIPTLIYGSLLIVGLIILFVSPPGHIWIDVLGLGMFEFALGGSLVFLAGLIAVDVFSKKATGAVKGVIGLFSYVGAATQEWISGILIEAGKTVVDGKDKYNFDFAFYFWIGAAVLSLIAALTVWNVKSKA